MSTLRILSDELAILRLDADRPPAWVLDAPGLLSITRRGRELSVVCADRAVPDGVEARRGWRALEVEGPMDLGLVGVLAGLAAPLAAAGIALFAVSTHDTDVLLVRDPDLERAAATLVAAGHSLRA